jgi:hypothetical protein
MKYRSNMEVKSMKIINAQSLLVCKLVYQRGVVLTVFYRQITKINFLQATLQNQFLYSNYITFFMVVKMSYRWQYGITNKSFFYKYEEIAIHRSNLVSPLSSTNVVPPEMSEEHNRDSNSQCPSVPSNKNIITSKHSAF